MTTRCTRCGGPIVEIVLSGDSNLTMRSCSTCDTTEWETGGEPVELDAALTELAETSIERRHRRSR